MTDDHDADCIDCAILDLYDMLASHGVVPSQACLMLTDRVRAMYLEVRVSEADPATTSTAIH